MTRVYAWALAAGTAGAVLVLGLAAVAAEHTGRELSFFTRDPLAELHEPIYTGAVSTLGALVWWTGGVAALLAAAVVRRGEAAHALAAGGLLTLLLAFDDLFVMHEELIPDLVGIPERVVYAAYAAAGLAFVWWHRRFLVPAPRALLLGLAVALFGLSIAFDVVAPGRHALEDGAKLLGIVAWTTLFVVAALEELSRPEHPPARARR